LGKPVFVFNLHVIPDNDRCIAFDRQRLEVKTDSYSPPYLKGFLNESVTFRWRFKIPAGFQPSKDFTHIHQVKAGDGDEDAPLVTLTLRKANPDQLQIIHSTGTGGVTEKLLETPAAPFIGTWVEAYEKVTYSHTGQYSLVLYQLNTAKTLLSYSKSDIDLWRAGTTFGRPKWGIYRGLNASSQLRDEQVRFDRFCLAKGKDDCPPEQAAKYTVLSAANDSAFVAPGSIASFYGSGIANSKSGAGGIELPATLDGVSVVVTDSAAIRQTAGLFYVSPTQINFEMPVNTALGQASVAVVNSGTSLALASVAVMAVAPALFTADGSGLGVAAGLAIGVDAIGRQSAQPIYQCSNGTCSSLPVDLSNPPVYLSLFGTGIRNRTSLGSVQVTIKDTNVPVMYAGPEGYFPGLDQVNLAVPPSLRGSGETDLLMSVDGQTARTVRVNFR
jgi:uncharacterized protein (TIGR03437 family)